MRNFRQSIYFREGLGNEVNRQASAMNSTVNRQKRLLFTVKNAD